MPVRASLTSVDDLVRGLVGPEAAAAGASGSGVGTGDGRVVQQAFPALLGITQESLLVDELLARTTRSVRTLGSEVGARHHLSEAEFFEGVAIADTGHLDTHLVLRLVDVGHAHVGRLVTKPRSRANAVHREEGDGLGPLVGGRVHRNELRVLDFRVLDAVDLRFDDRGLLHKETQRLLRVREVEPHARVLLFLLALRAIRW
jgi:hypothetical protein